MTFPTERASSQGLLLGRPDLLRRYPGVISTGSATRGDVANATYRTMETTPKRSRSSSTRGRSATDSFWSSSFRSTIRATLNPPGQRQRSQLPLGDLLTRTTSRSVSQKTPSPMWTPPASGRARSSPRSRRPAPFGRRSARASGLSGALPRRLYLSFHSARLEAAAQRASWPGSGGGRGPVAWRRGPICWWPPSRTRASSASSGIPGEENLERPRVIGAIEDQSWC